MLCGPGSSALTLVDLGRQLGGLFPEILVCGDQLEPLLGLGLTLVAELASGPPPLPGLHAALTVARYPQLVAVSCSEPLPSLPLLRRLATHDSQGNVLLMGSDPPRLLPGRYRRGCLGPFGRALRDGVPSLEEVLRRLHGSHLPAN